MMKSREISESRAYLEKLEERDVMEESMLNTLMYLESHNMKGYAMPEYGTVELKFGGGGYTLSMKVVFDAKRKTACSTVAMPANCVKEKRTVVAELLHRINFITVLGQWRLDPKDGECHLNYIHYIGDTPMSLNQCERMIDISLLSAHQYEDTLVPLMMGREPDMDDACDEYKEMMGVESGMSSIRRMLLKALEARKQPSEDDGLPALALEAEEDDA